jgi:glyoxylase-like metal-dependent hydrolase (beta-lactamase superfamily II)
MAHACAMKRKRSGETRMKFTTLFGVAAAALIAFAGPALAQGQPQVATRKVDGTDNVYLFRYGGHQSIFIVTKAGVIVTDPISYLRSAKPYVDEIRKVTDKPIKFVIYSHHHYDHIAGGKPFKDAGATFVAHKNAVAKFKELKKQNSLPSDVVMPDKSVGDRSSIKLGETTLELVWVGRNHSDNSLAMILPKEKIAFTVDFAPIETVQFRNMPDNASPLEHIASLKKLASLNWDRMIPGHPYAGGRFGTKKDVLDHVAYLEELSAATKQAAEAGKCFDTAMKEVRLPKYEKWGNYENGIGPNVERFCYWWGRGY